VLTHVESRGLEAVATTLRAALGRGEPLLLALAPAQGAPVKALKALYPPSKQRGIRRGQWHHRGVTLFVTGKTPVGPYRLASARRPLFAIHHGEPGA